MTRIAVISDTHVTTLESLPPPVLAAMKAADCLVHCGDFTGPQVLEELSGLVPEIVAVYGNTDPAEVRRQLPAEVVFEVDGKTIAVIHPHWGGPPFGLVADLVAHFPQADVILFGHTHDTFLKRANGRLLLNPGQGYPSFMVPATIGILTVGDGEAEGEILTLT